jgi:segregation and condensation protein B
MPELELPLKNIIEALLLSAQRPLSIEQLQLAFEESQKPNTSQIKAVLDQLSLSYSNSAIELKRLSNGYCLQTKIQYSPWINRLNSEKASKYSRALLETLAIIAYRQPVTRADIEEIRGVSVNTAILKTLMERDWVKVAGHRDVPGKPAVYVTTKAFLDYFNLAALNELPALSVIEKV